MKKSRLSTLFVLAMTALLIGACTKELSFESGNGLPGNTSEGSLVGDPADCANITLRGIYAQGISLDTTHKLDLELDIVKEGSWTIRTDTVNGIFFNAFGSVTAPGVYSVSLQGSGTPLNPGSFTFTVNYKQSSCTFVLNVLAVAKANGNDYFPTTTNSKWWYRSSEPGAAPEDTALQLSTGTIVNIPSSGQNYSLFTFGDVDFVDSFYYRKTPGNYFEYADVDLFGFTDQAVMGEVNFLKDNVLQGNEWISAEYSGAISGVPVKLRNRYRLSEKDVNVVIDNLVYRNTIKVDVTQEMQGAPGTPFAEVFSYQTWFARGIGLINVVVEDPFFGYQVYRYDVK